MNPIVIYCLLLFLVYLGIVCLLVYYFFRSRETWNIFLAEIYQDLESLISGCSIHNTLGLFIPGFIYSSSSGSGDCRDCIKEKHAQQSNLYNVQILGNIYPLIKNIDANMLDDIQLSSKCKMIQLILEYIIRNYQELSDADYSLYTRLQAAYLADASSLSNLENVSRNVSKGIEIIPILEEYSRVFDKLDTICQGINIEMINGTFMIAFYQDLKTIITAAKKYLLEFNN